jgi:hypothetical protein
MAFAGSSTTLTSLSDVAGNTNEEAIGVVYDLNIVTGNPDGTFQPEKAVTRAEFAAMITRALAIPDSALAAYSTTSFKDTTGYTWAVPYLAFCNSKGIMLGDGAGNAMPGKTINANEAVTMTLRALGYTANSAELVGVWPSNYVTKAQELDLYDDVANTTGVNKANAAQIIYNALTVQKVAVNSDGDTNKLYDEDDVEVTLLSAGLNCESTTGVAIGIYDVEDSLINIGQYLGQYGTVYTNTDDEIVAFISDSDALVGRFVDEDTFKTTTDEKEYNVASTVALYTMVNGEADAIDGLADSTDYTDIDLDDEDLYGADALELTLNVDLSGKTIKEIYTAVVWTVSDGAEVDAADLADIEDEEFLGNDFILDDNDDIDYTQFALVGAANLSDIAADDVVYVYANSDDEIVRIEVGTETATGIVKNFKDTGTDVAAKYTIAGTTYKNAEEVVNGVTDTGNSDSIDEDDVTEDVTAVLDARGFVFSFEATDSADNYAVVEKMSAGINNEVKLMLADGTEKTFTVDDDDDYAALTKGAVIGYGLDSDGLIDEVEQITAADSGNKLVSSGGVLVSNTTIAAISNKVLKFTDDNGHSAASASIDSSVVVFTFDGDDYDVTTIDKVDKSVDSPSIISALIFEDSDFDNVIAMIVDADCAEAGDSSYAVISERNKDANDDNDAVWHVVGYTDGTKADTLTDSDASGFFEDWDTPDYDTTLGLTDIYVYDVTIDADGVITDATKVTNTTDDVKIINTDAGTYSATGKGATLDDASSRDSVTIGSTKYALADDVLVYEVDDDEYSLYSGNLKENDQVILINTDTDDNDEYDIVIFARP